MSVTSITSSWVRWSVRALGSSRGGRRLETHRLVVLWWRQSHRQLFLREERWTRWRRTLKKKRTLYWAWVSPVMRGEGSFYTHDNEKNLCSGTASSNSSPASCSPACRCSSTRRTPLRFPFWTKLTSTTQPSDPSPSQVPPPPSLSALPSHTFSVKSLSFSLLQFPESLSFPSRVLAPVAPFVCRRYRVVMLDSCFLSVVFSFSLCRSSAVSHLFMTEKKDSVVVLLKGKLSSVFTRQRHRVATRRKPSQRKRRLHISEQYQIDILEEKNSRGFALEALRSRLTRQREQYQPYSMSPNMSLSMYTFNTHYIYLLYIHTHVHINWTNMHCFILYITHYKSYYWIFQWPLHCTVYRCHTKCNVTPLV